MKKAELQEKTVEELKELAKDNEVEGRSSMGKDELVEALAKIRSPKSSRGEAKTIMTTPREDQNALGYQTRGADTKLSFEQAPAGGEEQGAELGGTGGDTVPVTDSSGPSTAV